MKTLFTLKTTFTYLMLAGIMLSCSKDDAPDILPVRPVTFGFAVNNGAGRVSDVKPSHARLSIEDAAGNEIHSEVVLELFVFGDSYVSESIELVPDTYKLTLFQILDEDGAVIMASPVEGSLKAEEVSNPLPIQFEVEEGLTTNVVPEVLWVEDGDQPSDFGYVNFGFSLIDDFTLDLTVISDYDSSFVKSVISIRAYDEDSVAITDWTHRYESGIESATGLLRSARFFEIRVEASLHHSLRYFLTSEYLRSLETLNLRLTPSDFAHKYEIFTPTENFHNSVSLYLPKDGCVSYARLDGTGKYFFYLHISTGYYEQETGAPLLPPNLFEVFYSGGVDLSYPTAVVAANAENTCDEINEQHDDNPDYEVELFVLMDDGGDFNFAAYRWDSTTGIWSDIEE